MQCLQFRATNGNPVQEIWLLVISIVSGIMKWLLPVGAGGQLLVELHERVGRVRHRHGGESLERHLRQRPDDNLVRHRRTSYGCAQFCFSSHGAMPRAAVKLTSGW